MKSIRYISIIFSILLIGCIFYGPAAGEQEKVPKLELKVLSTDHMVFIPAEIEFRLTNMTSETIQNIDNIDYKDVGTGITIHIVYNGKDREIFPEYPTHEENRPVPPKLNLEPGKSATYRTSLIMDWDNEDDLIIFKTTGTWTIYGTHPVPGYGLIESNRVKVRYREPETENETMAVNLLKPYGNNLEYLYIPLSVYKIKNENTMLNMVKAVREIYEMKPPTVYKNFLKETLIAWQGMEKKGQISPAFKMFEKFNLQDLDLRE